MAIQDLSIYKWAHLALRTMYNIIYYGASVFVIYIMFESSNPCENDVKLYCVKLKSLLPL